MTYSATEAGVFGQPVELYEFVQAGVFTRVTSVAVAQIAAGNSYAPLAGLRRTEIKQDNEAAAGEITVTVPSDFDLALQFRGTLPSSLPSLTIFTRHNNDVDLQVVTIWKGTVISCNPKGDKTAELRCVPPTYKFMTSVPRAVYSPLCNNQLYDSQCGVNRVPYKFSGIVGTVTVDGSTVTIPGLGAGANALNTSLGLGLSAPQLANFFQRGLVGAGSPSELRMVVEVAVGSDPDTIRVSKPFRGLGPGDTIEVFAGCDHSPTTCNQKFKNYVTAGVPSSGLRFGGYPYVPTNNPFEIELDSGLSRGSGAGSGSSFSGVSKV